MMENSLVDLCSLQRALELYHFIPGGSVLESAGGWKECPCGEPL